MIEEKVTYCRICEPFCGLIATVENDKLVKLRPDNEHPLSKGFACPKGIAYTHIQNDPDRVLYPLRRRPDGEFERVSWDTAMSDIVSRLKAIKKAHGPDAISLYFGNPSALNYSHALWTAGFMAGLGSPHSFSAGSQDTNSRFVASHLLYGLLTVIPIPDVESTELLVILGANPVVSHGSLFSSPRLKEHMQAITKRGGRVLVIDPRRTETAREHDWLPILPDSDAWLLLSLLNVLFSEGFADEKKLAKQAKGVNALRLLARSFTPESTQKQTGIPADEVRRLARDLATKRAALYGRTGTCLGSSATLVNFLMDTVNLVAGNLDSRGGAVFGESPQPLVEDVAHLTGAASYNTRRSRVGNLPEVLGTEPAANMAAEITTPGKGQIRAMLVSAGNPVLSTPNGEELEAALDQLDLMVSIDLYVNETNRHAHYVLPGTAMYEHDDFPIASLNFFPKPFMQATEAVVPPAGEARPEWQIIDDIARGLGFRALPNRFAQLASRASELVGLPVTPRLVVDALIRTGRGGDLFGLRPWGHNFSKLVHKHPHGVVFAEQVSVGRLRKVVRHKDHKIHLDHPEIRSEVGRLMMRSENADFPMYLIGMRELRSENSWMHNVGQLRAARTPHAARMHPVDAERIGVSHNGNVRLVSASGAIELPVLITEDIQPGVVAVPHGWGHQGTGGWRTANKEGGANVNTLASSRPQDLDPLSGMSHLSGIRIRAERVSPQQVNPERVSAEVPA